jgi:YD repeat-containing protein
LNLSKSFFVGRKLRHFLLTWLKKKGIDDAFIQPYFYSITALQGGIVSYTISFNSRKPPPCISLSNVTYKKWPIQSESSKISESYSYDIAGNVVTYTDPNNNKNDEGVTTKYTYDKLNRLNSVKDSMNQITSYQYDRSGQVINTTMQNSSNGPVVSKLSE